MDWHAWHDTYDRANSPLVHRLATVQDRIRDALDDAPRGPLTVLSVCAGQGHDLIGACGWLEERGFERLWVSEPELVQAVGAHRYGGVPGELDAGQRMFTFVGYDVLRGA